MPGTTPLLDCARQGIDHFHHWAEFMNFHVSPGRSWPLAVLSVVLFCGAGPGKMETFVSQGTTLPIEVFEPAGPGPHPAVVIAYGTDGMTNGNPDLVTHSGDAIRHFADELAKAGIVALIPDYFEITRTRPGLNALNAANTPSNVQAWVQVVEDAMVYADNRVGTDKKRIGLLGFSLGGHVVLRAGKEATTVKARAVVEFSGPTTIYGLGAGLGDLPFLQVHHGEKDMIVPRAQTDALDTALAAAGKKKGVDYFILWYAHEGHVPFKDPKVAGQAEKSAIDFLKKYL